MSERLVRCRGEARGVAYATLRGCTAAVLLALGLALSACATNERLPAVPLSLAASAVPLEIQDARYYCDGDAERISALATQSYMRARESGLLTPVNHKPPVRTFLAMSGGGDDGAFGAGLVTGWTARGDRPEFTVVTGVSTGALSAPFIYLGPEYDQQLRSIYTRLAPETSTRRARSWLPSPTTRWRTPRRCATRLPASSTRT